MGITSMAYSDIINDGEGEGEEEVLGIGINRTKTVVLRLMIHMMRENQVQNQMMKKKTRLEGLYPLQSWFNNSVLQWMKKGGELLLSWSTWISGRFW